MIVCHCAAVTDTHIEKLIEQGASSVADIVRRCGAGRRCAPCRGEIAAMLSSAEMQPYRAVDSPALGA